MMNVYEIVDRLLDLRLNASLTEEEKDLLLRASNMLNEVEKCFINFDMGGLETILYPLKIKK